MTPLLARSVRILILLVAITLVVGAVVVADQGSHSVSDTLISASPALLVVALASAALLFALERSARARRG